MLATISDFSETEIEEGIIFVLKGYEDIIAVLWKKAVEKVLCNDIFKNKDIIIAKLLKEKNFEVVQEWELHGINSCQKVGYMGKLQLIWYNPRLSYPFDSGSLIADSNNFCQSSV